MKIIDSKTVYDKLGRVVIEDLLEFADGSRREWVYFKTSGAVAVLALTEDNQVILTKQYRHPMGKVIVDLPAGGIIDGETVEQAALRELKKETGFTAGRLEWLGRFSWAPSNMSGCVEIFLAQGLKKTESFDSDEIASIEMQSFDDVLGKVLKGEYVDSALVVAVLLFTLRKLSG